MLTAGQTHTNATAAALAVILARKATIRAHPRAIAAPAQIWPGRVCPPVGWAAVTGAAAIAGIGFTVSLLIASLAFGAARLEEAKLVPGPGPVAVAAR